MMASKSLLIGAASAALIGFTLPSAAGAVTFFKIDPNPAGTKLFIDMVKGATSSTGDVLNPDDIAIAVVGSSDFANGFSSIKPVKGGSLTQLVFTPVDPNAFGAFSFRGQDILAGQLITVTVQDNQGHAPETFSFTEGNANQDFTRIGIIAAFPGETIKWVEIQNLGAFEEAKQFEFGVAVPEPSSWALMLVGFGSLGWALRFRKRARAGVL